MNERAVKVRDLRGVLGSHDQRQPRRVFGSIRLKPTQSFYETLEGIKKKKKKPVEIFWREKAQVALSAITTPNIKTNANISRGNVAGAP